MGDLYPYQHSDRTTVLGEYQRQARKPVNYWLLCLALSVLTFVVLNGYLRESDPEEVSWSALRTADVELSAAGHAEAWPVWGRWLAGIDTQDEALDWMAEEFARLDRNDELTEEGRDAAVLIMALAADQLDDYQDVDWQERYHAGIMAWERIAARRILEENPPDWWLDVERDYQTLDQQTAWKSAAGSAVWILVFLVGLPFIPAALRCFLTKNHKPFSPATLAWRPDVVTVRYIATDLIAIWATSKLFEIIPYSAWENFFGPTLIVTDTIWRVTGAILLCLVLLIRWRHGLRLLGLAVRPVLPPILGMLALGFLYDWLVYFVVGQLTRGEDLSFLSSVEEGAWGLAFAVISGVILAPLVEEVVYRGVLFQSYSRRFGFAGAVILSTLLFTVVHYYGIYGSLSVAFFGFGACALYRATGSLWTGIIFHAINNGLITLAMWPLYHTFGWD